MAGRKQQWPPRIFTCGGKDRVRLWVGGKRKQFTLGPTGSAEARAEYARLLAERQAKGGISPLNKTISYTVAELIVQYLEERPRGDRRAAHRQHRAVSRLQELYGHTEARDFSPRGMVALQHSWIAESLSRRYVQHLAKEIRQFFRWCVAEDYVPAPVADALWYTGLLDRDACPFRPRVRPVEDAVVDQTLPHLPAIVRAMIRLQRFTGMRPGEVCYLRPCDVDQGWKVIEQVPIWLYRLDEHKNDWRGHYRWIPIGPQGQEVLKPFLQRDPVAYCFSPREVSRQFLEEHGRAVHFGRTRTPGVRYRTESLDKVVRMACDRVDRLLHARKAEAGEVVHQGERLFPRWTPNQVRHQVGTLIETELGREDARCALGHKHPSTTAIYAEQVERAARVFAKYG